MRTLRAWLVLLAGIVVLAGCEDDNDEQLPPDGPPVIRRTQPQDSTVVDTPNQEITLSYLMADNEQLSRWEVMLKDSVTGDTTLLEQAALTGNQQERSIQYTIPDTFPLGLRRLVFTARVYDNQNAVDSTQFLLEVQTPEEDTCTTADQYEMLRYTNGDTLFNGAGNERYRFNFVQNTYANSQEAADIAEATDSSDTFDARLVSPNTSPEAVFVMLRPSEFNYDEASWCTLDQAFRTHEKLRKTPELEEGDLVILNMDLVDPVTPQKQHYAIMRILAINETAMDDQDYILFEYQRTENN
jgi:hypothetical protein